MEINDLKLKIKENQEKAEVNIVLFKAKNDWEKKSNNFFVDFWTNIQIK